MKHNAYPREGGGGKPPKTSYMVDLSLLQYSIKFRATFCGI